MKGRLVILTEIISPYRIPLFNALAQGDEIDPYAIFLSETDPILRQWRVYKDDIRFPYCVLPAWRKRIGKYSALLNWGLTRGLRAASPNYILCGGYNYVASWQALRWARSHNVPFLLWSESVLQDRRHGHTAVEFLKRQFLDQCDGFVVPGTSAREYLVTQGINEKAIFTAPNAVDNELFAHAAADARQSASRCRSELGLPQRYFLFVGRLVREKGVFDLIAAYAKLNPEIRKNIGMVFAGDGAARRQLEAQALAIAPGVIRFAGFTHREQLPAYYALADALILPTHTDTWGLVVNEAMACSLPVVVSRVAGCAADLVRDHWNGFLVSPGGVSELSEAMQYVAGRSSEVVAMAGHSSDLIAQYTAQTWCAGLSRALESVGASYV